MRKKTPVIPVPIWCFPIANLLVSHIAFEANRIIVMTGKGAKDRTILMGYNLKSKLLELCAGKKANEKVFGFKAVSLGMKIKEWGDKAAMPIKAHSLRHYFATNLMERGANIKQVQELLGHESLATTQIYLSLMADHLEDAIQLLECAHRLKGYLSCCCKETNTKIHMTLN